MTRISFSSVNYQSAESLALAMFQAYVFDLWHERTLMHDVNFRPSD